MRWTKAEIQAARSQNLTAEEDVVINSDVFEGFSLINGVRDVHAAATGYLDEHDDLFYAVIHVTGTMLLPDAITGEEIEHPFDTESEETYSFHKTDDENIRDVTDDVIELMPAIIDAIIMEVPLQVTNASEDDYPHGDGWAVITEEAYLRDRESRIDPRLAKLMEYKEEE
ncbi:MAG TPA: hypothetical protein DCG51_03810 [Erysipelotrichaceae bacterium]|nr:hypothetical protein [Erysipelotrichaceae bacterium]